MVKKIFFYITGILVCCFLMGFSQAKALVIARSITIEDDFSSDPSTNWQLNGNAEWNGAQVHLTPSQQNQKGSIWYKQSFDLSKYKSFTVEFDFSVGCADSGADGITFAVIDKSNGLNALGDGGGGLGYKDISNSFAVEFDTYQNSDYNDPSDDHIGIDKDGSIKSLTTLSVENIETAGSRHAKIEFDITTGAMSVYLDKDKDGDVDYTLNYTLTDFTPFEAYFGFTGATGACYSLQSVDNFNLTLNPVPIPSSMLLLLTGLV